MIIGNFRYSNLHSSQSAILPLCRNDKHTRTQLANKTSSGSTRSRCSELCISRVSNKFFTRQHLITFFSPPPLFPPRSNSLRSPWVVRHSENSGKALFFLSFCHIIIFSNYFLVFIFDSSLSFAHLIEINWIDFTLSGLGHLLRFMLTPLQLFSFPSLWCHYTFHFLPKGPPRAERIFIFIWISRSRLSLFFF